MPATHRGIVTDTVKFLPNLIPIPEAPIDDHIHNLLAELTNMLTNKAKTFPPTFTSPASCQAIIQLAKMFHRDVTTEEPHPTLEGEKETIHTPVEHPKQPPKRMTDAEFDALLASIKPKNSTKPTQQQISPKVKKFCTSNACFTIYINPHPNRIFKSFQYRYNYTKSIIQFRNSQTPSTV